MTHRLNALLLVLLLLFGGPYYWLFLDNHPHGVAPMPVHMAELRQLASSQTGPQPDSIGLILEAHRLLPCNLFAAGSGMKRCNMGKMAFILPVTRGRPLLIEPGKAIGPDSRFGVDRRYEIGEILADRARRQAGQVISTDGNSGGTVPHALAPGVVAIPAASHTARTQMIFVRLANGEEYLFAGDVAPMARSWLQQRGRGRLVSDWLFPEDRHATFAWLATIQALKHEAPGLHVVPGYDYEWLMDYRNNAGMRVEFSPSMK